MSQKSLNNWAKQAATFCKIKNVADLAQLLEVNQHQLQLLAAEPVYHIFEIPKPNGKSRLIEEPSEQLKSVQQKLNNYLQFVYYFNKPAPAYGFVLSHKTDAEPRNILTNAEQHLGANYLLNVDLKDFFHHVSWQKVYTIFTNAPFMLGHDLAVLCANISTFNGRLPMGSPTSPVLSNFAAIPLDKQFIEIGQNTGIVYTRFVDDLSFSHVALPIEQKVFHEIEHIINGNGFLINPLKVKWYGKEQDKLITGLMLTDTKAIIPPAFFEQLGADLIRLQHICEVAYGLERNTEVSWLNTFKQSIEGRINYVQFIYGNRHDKLKKLRKKLNKSLQAAHKDEIMQWLDLPYGFF